MAAGIDSSHYPDYHRASENLSMRTSIRRTSSTAGAGNGIGQESPQQQAAADREALLIWLKSATELLTVWREHLERHAARPIREAEIEIFIERLLEINSDVAANLHTEDSLLSRLGYAGGVATWKSELAEPWQLLMDAVYPYSNALRRIDISNLKDPVRIVEFEEITYVRSKVIRRPFAQYRKELEEQIVAIQNLLERGK